MPEGDFRRELKYIALALILVAGGLALGLLFALAMEALA